MLNQASSPVRPTEFTRPTEFEWSLHRLAQTLGAPLLGPLLHIKPGYLSRMANPWDSGAHFRARDLAKAINLGLARFGPDLALAPLAALAADVGCGIYPLPPAPDTPDVILGLSQLARAHGDLGQHAVVAIDPRGDRGAGISRSELILIESAGYGVASHAAAVMHAARALHQERR